MSYSFFFFFIEKGRLDEFTVPYLIILCFNLIYKRILSRATKGNSNPRLKGNRKGIIVKGKEFYIPILNTFPTR